MKKYFILTFLFSLILQAGPNIIGNGGTGVRLNGETFLLDLVENGSHKNVYIGEMASAYSARATSDAFGHILSPEVLKLVSKKLQDLEDKDIIFANAVVESFKKLNWQLVDFRLQVIPVDTAVSGELLQMAIRTNEVVLIDQIYWAELSDIQKVALLFHEALYTLIEPVNGSKSAYKARSLNGFIFSKLFAKETKETFSKRLHPLFPSEIKYPVAYHYITETQIHEITSVINPFLLISRLKGSVAEKFYITKKMNLTNPDQDHKPITDAICSGTELNIKLGAHTLVQSLDQGDNNSQQSLQLIEVEDLFFSPMHIPANIECKMRLTAIQSTLKKYFFDFL